MTYEITKIPFVIFPSQEYELQLMTYRAFVESQQKSPVKRRRVLSSSDAITQEVRLLPALSFSLQEDFLFLALVVQAAFFSDHINFYL